VKAKVGVVLLGFLNQVRFSYMLDLLSLISKLQGCFIA